MMSVMMRQYQHPDDYHRIDMFLTRHYQPGNADGNLIEPAWEYMHAHPMLQSEYLKRIGVWEEAGEIVGVAHYEWCLGEAFFQFHPAFRHLRQEMLTYAEENLHGWSRKNDKRYLKAYVNENDDEFLSLVKSRGYSIDPEESRPMYQFVIPDPFPSIILSDRFRLKSLADECDWRKVNRVLWRGFDHEGEPGESEEELENRRKLFDSPRGRRDLKIVVEALVPGNPFVAFCGMFYEPTHQFAYVEPVATDPDYRRLGLGKAAVLEGIRRCGELGATVAYVGADLEFYKSIGFTKVYNNECWGKIWDD